MGSVLALSVPFLGPMVVAWVALLVGVMAFYFLSISRQSRTRGEYDAPTRRQPTPREPGPANQAARMPWVSQPDLVTERSVSYDMENYPEARWGSMSPGTMPASPIAES